MSFEYCVIEHVFQGNLFEVKSSSSELNLDIRKLQEEGLTYLGQERWELMSTTPSSGGAYLYFKRTSIQVRGESIDDFNHYMPELGDTVIVHGDGDSSDMPGLVSGLVNGDPTQVYLNTFSIGGSGGSNQPVVRGSEPGQWEPKPINKQLIPPGSVH